MYKLGLILSPIAAFLQPQEICVKRVRTTAAQAVIVFEAPDTADCQVKVAYDSGLTNLAHDTNASLFPGSQNCGRAGNIVEGNTVTFVAGLRRAEKAADGKFCSRALEANTTLWFEIRSGGQTLAPQRMETRNPPLGNAYGEPYPFDAQAPGNYAWPTVDWTDLNKEYIDPLTGVKLRGSVAKIERGKGLLFSAAATAQFRTAFQ